MHRHDSLTAVRRSFRLGATPWRAPHLLIENSPVFMADRVQTPLLILHNDSDAEKERANTTGVN